MHRRLFLAFPLLGAAIAEPFAKDYESRLTLDGTTFAWQHRDDRLFGDLTAPAEGWLAVGFNDEPALRGTRFVIGVIGDASIRAELHIADPPRHRQIEVLGGVSDLRDLKGKQEDGRSRLSFSLPHRSTDRFAVDLMPGRSIHLMLAWSNEPDFTHHSAWRRHVDVIL